MKVIRFRGTNSEQKQFWKVLKVNVHGYFTENNISPKGNVNMLIKTVAMYTMYVAPFLLLFFISVPPFAAIPLVVLMGIGKAGIGMSVMHDGLHGSYSSRKWINKLAGSSMYLIGSNVFNWKIQHNIYHHAYTNLTGLDEDIQPVGLYA